MMGMKKEGIYVLPVWYKKLHIVSPMAVFLFLFMNVSSQALDFSLRAGGFVSIPYDQSSDYYDLGFGADVIGDIDISSILTNPLLLGYSLGPEIGVNVARIKGTGSFLPISSLSLGADLFYYPFSRMNLRIGGAMGFYWAHSDSLGEYYNTSYKYNAEIGFRFSPRISLSLYGGYRHYNYQPKDPLYQGIVGGITFQLNLDTDTDQGNVLVVLEQEESVFPIFLGLYQENPVGTLLITNRESAEIRNIVVTFRAGDYTSSQFLCGSLSQLGKRRSVRIPLYADFSSRLFGFLENGRIPGEVIIQYELLGQKRTSEHNVIVSVYNRNSFRWSDTYALAAFVSPMATEILDYSKYIVGFTRDKLRTGLNRNMQFAIALFEGLRAGGINYSGDQQTPYTASHRDPAGVDYIQFPFQSLAFRSGDLDDLGLLYAASLEAAGIKAALIPMADDFLVAFSLGISSQAAESLFNDLNNLLFINNDAWMVVSLATLREGFFNSWYQGMNVVNSASQMGMDVELVILQEAWAIYPSAALGAQDTQFEKPGESTVIQALENTMSRYITAEFGPKISALLEEIRTQGDTEARYNQIGLLYVRAGMYQEAKGVFQRSAAMGSTSALVNLGNLGLMENDLDAAEIWYRRVLESDAENRAARNGLDRIAIDRLD